MCCGFDNPWKGRLPRPCRRRRSAGRCAAAVYRLAPRHSRHVLRRPLSCWALFVGRLRKPLDGRTSAGSVMLAILTTHPIQYQAPLWQALAVDGRVPFEVWYLTDHGTRPSRDREFGQTFSWDIDTLCGYPHRFLSTVSGSTPAVFLEMPLGRAFARPATVQWCDGAMDSRMAGGGILAGGARSARGGSRGLVAWRKQRSCPAVAVEATPETGETGLALPAG